MSHRADMSKLLKRAKKEGCEIVRTNGGHWKITPPGGDPIIAAFSPNSGYAVTHLRKRLSKQGIHL
jgi:hypothetical protein